MDRAQMIDEQVRLVKDGILREASFYILWGNTLEAGLSPLAGLNYVRDIAPHLELPCADTVVDALSRDVNVGNELRDSGATIHPVALEVFTAKCLSSKEARQNLRDLQEMIRQASLPNLDFTSSITNEVLATYSPERTLGDSLSSVSGYLTKEAEFQLFRASHGFLNHLDGGQVVFFNRFRYLLESKVPLDRTFLASVNGDYPSQSRVDEVVAKMRDGVHVSEAIGYSNIFPTEIRDIFLLASPANKSIGLTENDCREAMFSSFGDYVPGLEKAYRTMVIDSGNKM